jgi:tetratricopeptide (TPR) repeat protein
MKHRLPGLLIGVVCLCFSAAGQSSSWESHMDAGDNAFSAKHYSDAEQAFREALKLAEKFKSDDPRLAVNLIKLAESFNNQSKREEAEAAAKRSLVALDKAMRAPNASDLQQQFYKAETSAMILDKAATIFVEHKKYSEAEPIYKRLIAIRDEFGRINRSPKGNEEFLKFMVQMVTDAEGKTADACDKLANLYLVQRKLEEAEPLYQRSLKIRESRGGADKPPAAISLSNLATLYAVQGKFDKAEPLYARAASIFEQSNLLDKPEVATAFENYSLLLRKTGREAEAARMLEKARAVRAKVQQTSH